MLLKRITALFFVTMLSACQSTKTPAWYLKPEINNPNVISVVGQGWTLAQAKKNALSAINQQLWTQVKSSNSSRNIVNDIDGSEHYQQFNDSQVKTQTAELTLNGVQFTKTEQSGDLFYVQAKISKKVIKNQLISEIDDYANQADSKLDNLVKNDALKWWVNNRNTSKIEKAVFVRASVLSVLTQQPYSIKNHAIYKLKRKLSQVYSSLTLFVNLSDKEHWVKQFLIQELNNNHIKVTLNPRQKYSHRLNVKTTWDQNVIADAYIATAKVNLTLIDKKGRTIASREIIANANSLTSFARAKEGAARSFSSKLKNQNLWKALGL